MFYEGDDTGANDKWYSMGNLQITYLSPPFILYYIFCGCLTLLVVFMIIGATTANSDSNDGDNAGTTEDGVCASILAGCGASLSLTSSRTLSPCF